MADLLGPGAAAALNSVNSRPVFTPVNQGGGDPDSWARDCSSPSAADGTQDKAAHMNMLLAQLRSAIRGGAVPENSADDDMLRRAMRSQRFNWLTAGGSANAITLTPSPAFAALADLVGVPLRFLATGTNSAAATLAVNALTATAVTQIDGTALAGSEIRAGLIHEVIYDGTAFRIVSITGGGGAITIPPLGSVTLWASTAAAPAGWLKLNGALVSRTTYAALWSLAQASGAFVTDAQWTNAANFMWGSWSSGDGSTTFRLPDARGEFPRFFDDARGVDSGRGFGIAQRGTIGMYDYNVTDSTFYGLPGGNGGASTAALFQGDPPDGGTNSILTDWAAPTSQGNAALGTSIQVYHTRPRNIPFVPLIRAL